MNGLWIAVKDIFFTNDNTGVKPHVMKNTKTLVNLKKRQGCELLAIELYLHTRSSECIKVFGLESPEVYNHNKNIEYYLQKTIIDEKETIEFIANMKRTYFNNIFNIVTSNNEAIEYVSTNNDDLNFDMSKMMTMYTQLLNTFKHIISLWGKNVILKSNPLVKIQALKQLYKQMEEISSLIPQTCLAEI